VTCKIYIVPEIRSRMRVPSGHIMTSDTFAKIFSPERIRLLQRIRHNHIKNIYQLAKEMKKPYEVVFRNIKYLQGAGFVTVKRVNNKQIPRVKCDLTIEMFPDEKRLAL
jgi:predicted transcriptional regulator